MDLKISEILDATKGLLLTADCKKTIGRDIYGFKEDLGQLSFYTA